MDSPATRTAIKKRSKANDKMDQLIAQVEARGLSNPSLAAMTPDEEKKFQDLALAIRELDATISEQREFERGQAATRASADDHGQGVTAGSPGNYLAAYNTGWQARVTSEPMTYSQHNGNSYFLDLAYREAAGFGYSGEAHAATERLRRHAHEADVEARQNPGLRTALDEIRMTPKELRVNPNTTAGTGGEFVPPLWLVSQYAPYARPTRVFANRVQNFNLPPGIDVINIPKITTGSTTAIQAANAGAVSSTDIATATVAAPVNTIAGQEDISLQLLEQSPLAMDGVIFDDLSRDYDQRLDLQVIAGTGANGQHLGVLNVAQATTNTSILKANGITVASPTFHDASTAGTQFRSIVNGATAVATNRFAAATGVWVHPRRAASWAFASDTQNRPLYVRYSPYNAIGVTQTAVTAEGVCGEVYGLPVVEDANMITTMNATATTGGTADAVVVLKEDDMWLWEGTIRMRALPEILSGTLQIRFQLYAYSAFQPGRFLPSISILTGNTGLAAPTF